MKRNTLIFSTVITVLALLISACGANPTAVPKPADSASQSAASHVTESPQATEASTPVATPQFTEVPKPTKTKPMLYLTSVKGQVEVREKADATYAPAKVGQKIGEGAQIRTGAESVVVLYRDKLSMVVVDQSSEVQVKQLAFKSGKPITVVSLMSGAAAVEHKGKLPEGAILAVETPNKQQNGVVGSILRVSFDPETKLLTAVCVTGDCHLVRGDQTLDLKEGQEVDVSGLAPLPGMPEEMTTEQANQFLAMGNQMCGCQITLSEIREGGGLLSIVPPLDEVPSPEEDLQNSADENGDSENPEGTSDEMGGEPADGTDGSTSEGTDEPAVDADGEQPTVEAPPVDQPPTNDEQPPADEGEAPPPDDSGG